MHARHVLAALLALSAGSLTAGGQVSPSPAVDPVIARAQGRAAAGDSAAARMLLDSLLSSPLDNGGTPRAEAAFWLARYAATPADRERGLTALIVDYPFSPRADQSLFDLGMIELARGDRERAATHLSRFLSTPAPDSERTTASLALGKLLFELGDASRACAVLLSGRTDVPASAIELHNQFDFAAAPCRGVDTSFVRPPVDTAPPTSTAPLGEFTVQVAAYDSRAQADRLATRLRGRGLEARVIGKKKPFRVRVGHYMTHAAAFAALKKIDAIARSNSFVVLIGPEEM